MPHYDDEAVTYEFMRFYVACNGATASWLDLPGRPPWINYFSLGGTTDALTIGSNNFRSGDSAHI
jgi:hypothetical protein